MSDAPKHTEQEQSVSSLGDAHKRAALETFQHELERWNTENSPSESGSMVEDVLSGHPLHEAVVVLQTLYGGHLPKPALRHWRRFLDPVAAYLQLLNDTQGHPLAQTELDPAYVLTRWPQLPDHIRQTIMTLVRSVDSATAKPP